MSVDTQITHKGNNKNTKYYGPSEELVDWVRKRLELEKERVGFEKNIQAGEKIPNSFYKKMKASGARKAEILDEVVFPSMANLIYFFEAQAKAPRLKKLFEKDIIDLLDPRFVLKSVEMISMGINWSSYAFRMNNLSRLISTALVIDDTGVKRGTTVKDFRIALLFQLQMIIRDYVRRIFEIEYGFSSQITKSASADFDRTIGWLALIAKSLSQNAERELDRTMGFEPVWHSSKSDLASIKF